jgi:hypothetical protein
MVKPRMERSRAEPGFPERWKSSLTPKDSQLMKVNDILDLNALMLHKI